MKIRSWFACGLLLGCTGADDGSEGRDAAADAEIEVEADAVIELEADAGMLEADAGMLEADAAAADAAVAELDVEVTLPRVGGVLVNPGMGLANFHFGWWCNLPPITFDPQECASRVREHWPARHPDAGTAYFRWSWSDLEPAPGEINAALIDATLQSANALGETLGFRVMAVREGGTALPDWLHEAGVGGEWHDGTFWPDVRDPVWIEAHASLLRRLGSRYDGHPALDHIDIGTVGCWGEWNTACIEGVHSVIDIYEPASEAEAGDIVAAYQRVVDDFLTAFPETPVVMLAVEGEREAAVLVHATANGAGWRADCWGDWGIWGGGWNHHEDLYPQLIRYATSLDPSFPETWKRAPVQLEVCATMPRWNELGWTAEPPAGEVHKTFEWAKEVHASVLNAKWTEIPQAYVGALHGLLEVNGYRLALDRVQHATTVVPGGSMTLRSRWSNLGVAPPYRPRALTWRLRGGPRTVELTGGADIRSWLPGPHDVDDRLTVPPDLPPGAYALEVALLDRPGHDPETAALPPLRLAPEGRGEDGWTAVSQVRVE